MSTNKCGQEEKVMKKDRIFYKIKCGCCSLSLF